MVQLTVLKVWYNWCFFSIPKNYVVIFDGGGAEEGRHWDVVATG